MRIGTIYCDAHTYTYICSLVAHEKVAQDNDLHGHLNTYALIFPHMRTYRPICLHTLRACFRCCA